MRIKKITFIYSPINENLKSIEEKGERHLSHVMNVDIAYFVH